MAATKRNGGIDFLRFVACLCVVLLHCPFPGKLGLLVKSLSSFAVPFFFMVSGFFLWRADKQAERQAAVRQIRKLLLIFLVSYAVCLLPELFLQRHGLAGFFKSNYSPRALLHLVLLNDTGAMTHLWFLPALCYVYGIYYLFSRCSFYGKKRFLAACIAMLAPCYILQGVASLGVVTWLAPAFYRNFLFVGLPYFSLGYLLARRGGRKGAICSPVIPAAWVVLSVLLILGEFWLWGQKAFHVGTAPLSVSLFLLVLALPNARYPRLLVWIGARLSLYIYVIHWWMRYIEWQLITALGLESTVYMYVSPIALFLWCTLISCGLFWISRKFTKLRNRDFDRKEGNETHR